MVSPLGSITLCIYCVIPSLYLLDSILSGYTLPLYFYQITSAVFLEGIIMLPGYYWGECQYSLIY
jgi:hypothetical protein